MLKSLDFIPEGQRRIIMKLFFDFAGMGIIA